MKKGRTYDPKSSEILEVLKRKKGAVKFLIEKNLTAPSEKAKFYTICLRTSKGDYGFLSFSMNFSG